MVDPLLSGWLRWLGGTPCLRIHGKSKPEADWRTIDVYATQRRNSDSRWPLWRGTCITWTSQVIVVGWDFALDLLREQQQWPASRAHPVAVGGGRLNDALRRRAAGAAPACSVSEVLAHECGHTAQPLRLGALYLPLVGSVTLCREGPYWWNHFENQASELGQFGGIVTGSVCAELLERVTRNQLG